MRRWLAAAVFGSVSVLALAGCGGPAGVDGNLTDDWAPLAAPAAIIPQAGACLAQIDDPNMANYRVVGCDQPHLAETVKVGTFTGEDADRSSPPPAGSPALRSARAECDTAAKALLGADWHSGRLALTLLVPRAEAWTGGARWYRCELSETTSLDSHGPVSRTAGLAGTLRPGSPLAHTCFNPVTGGDEILAMTPVGCNTAHHSEYAGVYNAAAAVSYQVIKSDDPRIEDWCMGVIAAFTKVPAKSAIYRVGWIYYAPDQAAWADGDHGIQCFLWDTKTFKRSLKGAGPAALPIS